MKKIIVSVIAVFFSSLIFAQDTSAINGTYMSHGNDAKVTVYKSGELWQGKLVWSKPLGGDSVKDKNIFVFRDLTYTDSKWIGRIYNPLNDKEYDLEVVSADTEGLRINVKWGILKKGFLWKRVL